MFSLLAGRGISVAVAIFAAFAGLWGWLAYHDGKVIAKERARQIEKGRQLNAKARNARTRAESDARRVLQKYLRD